MKCSGCGKNVPFHGSVCPYCQRDKAGDKRAVIWAWIFAPIGAVIGGAAGAHNGHPLLGLFVGAIVAASIALAIWKPKRTKAPEVKPVREADTALPRRPEAPDSATARRLGELEALRKAGLVNTDEYETKRRAILDAL
jgi:uncharacterized membrane protein YfcA